MKRSIVFLLVSAAVLMFVAGPAMAGAFRIPEAGTPAMGQANAFVGQADDPSAVHHNPAGMTMLEGVQIMTGLNLITPESRYTPATFGVKSDADKIAFLRDGGNACGCRQARFTGQHRPGFQSRPRAGADAGGQRVGHVESRQPQCRGCGAGERGRHSLDALVRGSPWRRCSDGR